MNVVRLLLPLALSGAACASCRGNRADLPSDGASPADGGDGLPTFLLYETGAGVGSPIYALHVDSGAVYWVQRDQGIYRGSRDGRGPAVRWGAIKGPYSDTLTSDDQRVYWIEHSKLLYKDKNGSGEGEVVLPWDHTGGALAIDDRYVYTAMPGCPAILRLDKQSLALEEMDIPGIAADPRGGMTTLRLRDGGFYCAGWSNIFWIAGWQQPAQKLVSSANRLWGMAPAAGSLYWINNPSPTASHSPYMSRLQLDSGAVTDFPEEGGIGPSNLV